jgi:hypothetical protein
MTQNIYDDAGFFDGYSRLPRSVEGLAGAPEWPTVQTLLPARAGCEKWKPVFRDNPALTL